MLDIALLGMLGGMPAAAQQTGKTYRLGILTGRGPAYDRPLIGALVRTLADDGYKDGKNLEIVYRAAGGNLKRLPELAAELVRARPDAIVANGPDALAAMKRATTSLPIVMTAVPDPIGLRFIASFARPGGNITGIGSYFANDLMGKWVQLLKELVPNLRRIAVIGNPSSLGARATTNEAGSVARSIGVSTFSVDIRSADQIDTALREIRKLQADAIIVPPSPLISNNAGRIVRDVAALRLPALYGQGTPTTVGGLMSYNSLETGVWAKAATYVDRIFKGAKPADLPVEQPTTFDLVVNLKTARTLGITVPQSILLQATQVIR